VEAGDLGVDVPMLRGGSEQLFPWCHLRGAERRLSEVVEDERQTRVAPGQLRHIVEMIRVDRRQLEEEVVLRNHLERRLHVRPQDPVRVRLLMDQVAYPTQLRPGLEPCAPGARDV